MWVWFLLFFLFSFFFGRSNFGRTAAQSHLQELGSTSVPPPQMPSAHLHSLSVKRERKCNQLKRSRSSARGAHHFVASQPDLSPVHVSMASAGVGQLHAHVLVVGAPLHVPGGHLHEQSCARGARRETADTSDQPNEKAGVSRSNNRSPTFCNTCGATHDLAPQLQPHVLMPCASSSNSTVPPPRHVSGHAATMRANKNALFSACGRAAAACERRSLIPCCAAAPHRDSRSR